MSIEIISTSIGGSRLVRDYLAGSAGVRRFYPAGNPFDFRAFAHHWRRVRPRFSLAQRQLVAPALVPTSTSAEQRLARWVNQGGAVVTTGQQAGLFTGPLFTLYKALTAVHLARELESHLGILVLPVFWVASEDHDWAEANHTHLIGSDGRLVRLTAPSAEPLELPLPVSERRLGDDIESTVETLAQIAAEQTVDDTYVKSIRGAYVGGRKVADAFAEVMRGVLGPFDGYVVDAADPAVKRGSVGVLSKSLEGEEQEEEVLRAGAAELEASGYGLQVSILPRSPNVFVRTEHGRERLIRERSGGWIGRESGIRLARDEPLRILASDPGRVSPNVLLRPVVESAVFPVIAYVAGPGEIAYWGQAGGLFTHHGLSMPPVYPRASFQLLEPEVKEALQSTGLTLEEIGQPVHELVTKRAAATLPAGIRSAFSALREGVVERFDALRQVAATLDPTLTGAVGAARNRALVEARRLEKKILRAQKRREARWAGSVERVQRHLAPLGKPQERVLNGIPYLAREGEVLLHRLLEQIPSRIMEDAAASEAASGEIQESAPAD